jgi:hypothetical protein
MRSDDTKVGQIEAMMIEKVSGRVQFAVMSFGGVLGIRHDHHPIPNFFVHRLAPHNHHLSWK